MPLSTREIQELAHSVFGPLVRVEVRAPIDLTAVPMVDVTIEGNTYSIRNRYWTRREGVSNESERRDLYQSMVTLRSELRPPTEPPPFVSAPKPITKPAPTVWQRLLADEIC